MTERPRGETTTERRPRPDRQATTAPQGNESVVRGALAFARDRYLMGRLLGEGGMGEVVTARDRELGRDVAMKLVRPGRDSEANVVRFLREARVQAQLEHPSIVPVYDLGHDLGDRPFFTMRRVQGVTLDTILGRLRDGDDATEREYTRARLLAFFEQVCLAVDFSHARGILHRDLKPSNIMLGDFGEVYILDWGVAKVSSSTLLGGSRPPNPPIASGAPLRSAPSTFDDAEGAPTATGTAVGTPAYMAPEQALGLPVDARADVFTLGALLFEILALEPFVRDEDVGARMRDPTLEIIARPSQRAPSRGIPTELDEICRTALATNPSLRYPTARALVAALEEFLSADREDAHRRKLAKDLLDRARIATERVLEGGAEETRAEALAAIGRAIAIMPEEEAPLRLLHLLLARPPATLPRDLRGRVAEESLTRLRRILPRLAVAFGLPWVTLHPLAMLLGGVRHWSAVVPTVVWLIASFVVWIDYRLRIANRPRNAPIAPSPWPAIVLLTAIAATTIVAGPFFMVPPLAIAITTGLVLAGFRIRTRWIVTVGSLAVLVPTALAWTGIHPIYGWRDGALVIEGPVAFTPAMFSIVLTLTHLIVLLGAALFASSYRDTLDTVETRNLLLTWRLSQLVGAGHRGKSDD